MSRLVVPVGGNDHSIGSDSAPATLVEYGDFESILCGRAYLIVQQLREELGDNLRFVFRNFPLQQIHPHALSAAAAAEAAGLQDSYFEMHDMLYAHQSALNEGDLKDYAAAIQLSAEKFNRDRKAEPTRERIQADFMSGIRSGANGAPTFFINGRRHEGVNEYGDLLASIDQAMRYARL